MKQQKLAVIEEVMKACPDFVLQQDNALLKLSKEQLENIKDSITAAIQQGEVEYSKDRNNYAEVRSYARSMVMNHIKKSRDLNGGAEYVRKEGKTKRVKSGDPKGIDMDLLPDDLKEYVRSLNV